MTTETTKQKACRIENCKRPYRAKGYCQVHFHKWRRGELPAKPRYKICSEEKCRQPIFKFGRCEVHSQEWLQSKKAAVASQAVKAVVSEGSPAETAK